MSKKINLPELADAMSKKVGLTKKSAENFCRVFWDVVNEGLTKDGVVKIKGLGTFKLTTVGSRESVNVTTGERIVINGYKKVSFSPDDSSNNYLLLKMMAEGGSEAGGESADDDTENVAEPEEVKKPVKKLSFKSEVGKKAEEDKAVKPAAADNSKDTEEAVIDVEDLSPKDESLLEANVFEGIDMLISTPESIDEAKKKLELLKEKAENAKRLALLAEENLNRQMEVVRSLENSDEPSEKVAVEEPQNEEAEVAAEQSLDMEETAEQQADNEDSAASAAENEIETEEIEETEASFAGAQVGNAEAPADSEQQYIEENKGDQNTEEQNDTDTANAPEPLETSETTDVVGEEEKPEPAENADSDISSESNAAQQNDNDGDAAETAETEKSPLAFAGVGTANNSSETSSDSGNGNDNNGNDKGSGKKKSNKFLYIIIPLLAVAFAVFLIVAHSLKNKKTDDSDVKNEPAAAQTEQKDDVEADEKKDESPKTYILQKNESLNDVALKFFGTKDSMVAIIKCNPNLKNPNVVPVGTEIVLPANANIQNDEAEAKEEVDKEKPKTVNGKKPKTHVLQNNESVSDVSLLYYGTKDSMFAIIKANPQIKNPDVIPVGTELNLP